MSIDQSAAQDVVTGAPVVTAEPVRVVLVDVQRSLVRSELTP